MKKYLIAAAVLALSVSAAEAKCSKKALNGNWSLDLVSVALPGTASGGNFTFVSGGSSFTFNLSSFSSTKCRGSGTGSFDGTPVTLTMASEKIPGSSQNPNHLLMTINAGGTSVLFTMQRL